MFTLIYHKTLNLIEVVRLVGADAPDSKHSDAAIVRFGPDSSGLAKLLFEDRKVFLSYDELPRDSNGLYLVYVWIPASYRGETYNVLFNLLAIAGGYAWSIQRTPSRTTTWRYSRKLPDSKPLSKGI